MGAVRSVETIRASGQTQSAGLPEAAPPLAPGLYVVATPIGNLADITLRALDVLKRADVIACEDTRVTGRLLQHYGIRTETFPYHDHSGPEARAALLARLRAGGRVALASDAGTPLVSDPGYKLLRDAAAEGIAIVPIPGASAVLAALQISALPPDRFLFAGFLPPKPAARRKVIGDLAAVPATLIFFETGPRLAAALADLAAVLGDRPAAVTRELTKLYEEARRGTLAGLAADYAEALPPKGEIVIVVGPPAEAAATAEDVDALLRRSLDTMSVRDAAAAVAQASGRPRRDVYRRALALAEGKRR
ncbi:MAG: 16S rRNA (cytidine(1402)-2'-O)-methyltransferase [Rhodospirillaceae bacterium]|nr:16S rRNA (cytidine(1402)-2'-O)-methyltransferase [Rhodospirillaceae bacterium]